MEGNKSERGKSEGKKIRRREHSGWLRRTIRRYMQVNSPQAKYDAGQYAKYWGRRDFRERCVK